MRASSWRKRLCPSSPYPPLELQVGAYDEQIRLDICRTSDHPWFEPHRDTLTAILNTFSAVNQSFGYPQGLNYLLFPLFYVFHNDEPKTAVEDAFYALHSLVRIVLPVYPLHCKDTSALRVIESVSNLVCLECWKRPALRDSLVGPHKPFVTSLVTSMLPTLYANVFQLQDTLLLWDKLFQKDFRTMFDASMRVLVEAILFHKHVPAHSRHQVHATLPDDAAPIHICLRLNMIASI